VGLGCTQLITLMHGESAATSSSHIRALLACMQAPTALELGGPTYVTSASYDVVMRSVGAAVALVDAVVQRAKVCTRAFGPAAMLLCAVAVRCTVRTWQAPQISLREDFDISFRQPVPVCPVVECARDQDIHRLKLVVKRAHCQARARVCRMAKRAPRSASCARLATTRRRCSRWAFASLAASRSRRATRRRATGCRRARPPNAFDVLLVLGT
jgi:hypothetical protein